MTSHQKRKHVKGPFTFHITYFTQLSYYSLYRRPANQVNVVNIALAVSGFGPIPVVIVRLTDIVTSTGSFIGQGRRMDI